MSGTEIFRRFLDGDPGAFAALVEAYQGPLLRFASRLTGHDELAHDVVQETLLRVLHEGKSLSSPERLETWLYRVCRNLCVDVLKKESRMRKRQVQAALPEACPEEPSELEVKEERQLVHRMLKELPPNEREVVFLKVVKGMTYKEISEVTDHSSGHVGYLIHHGLRRLARGFHAAGLIEALPGAGERT